MKKIITILAVVFSSTVYSQIFWSEDFGTGCSSGMTADTYTGVNGLWTVSQPGINGVDPNLWYVSATEAGMGAGNCGDGCNVTAGLTNRTLHISHNITHSGMGDIGAAYDAGGLCGIISCPQTSIRAESPIINCTGYTNLTLFFNYILVGESINDFGSVQISIDGGATWSTISTPTYTNTCAGGQGLWSSISITLPASCDNNLNVKIGFYWENNDDGIGTDPSFAVDNIALTFAGTAAFGITGKAFSDNNNNCIMDASESGMNNVNIKEYDSVGNFVSQVNTYINGGYYFPSMPGTYTLVLDTVGTPYTVSCSPNIDTTLTISPMADSVNFGVKCKVDFDLGVLSIVNTGWVFPGQYHTLNLNVGDISQWSGFNCGAGVSGTVQITVTGPVTYYSPSGGALTPSVAGNIFTYTIPDFGAINNATAFDVILHTNNTAVGGNLVCATVLITATSATEVNTYNNTLSNCYTVVNSMDPNIKETYPAEVVAPYNDYFTYTVKFQNTGTAPAFNIVVKDTLSSLFDLSTFQMIGYSHPNNLVLTGNKLSVTFPNIMLQDSTTNEPASHGYFQYKIKPLVNLPTGTHIYNTASIYFDFNAPVVTNTTVNNYASTVGVYQNSIDGISIYPNPFNSQTTIIFKKEQKNTTIKITDILGQSIYQAELPNNQSEIKVNMSNEANGIYFLQIKTDYGILNRKIIKE